MTTNSKITPADQGIITVALDDASIIGLGDDDTVELVQAALINEAGFSEFDAIEIAYQAVHGLTEREA